MYKIYGYRYEYGHVQYLWGHDTCTTKSELEELLYHVYLKCVYNFSVGERYTGDKVMILKNGIDVTQKEFGILN